MSELTIIVNTELVHNSRKPRLQIISGQEIPPPWLNNDRLPLSSASIRATSVKTWDGGPHRSHEDCKAEASPPQTSASNISLFGISTKPKPRDSPENLSLMIDALETSPNAAKASSRSCSVPADRSSAQHSARPRGTT